MTDNFSKFWTLFADIWLDEDRLRSQNMFYIEKDEVESD